MILIGDERAGHVRIMGLGDLERKAKLDDLCIDSESFLYTLKEIASGLRFNSEPFGSGFVFTYSDITGIPENELVKMMRGELSFCISYGSPKTYTEIQASKRKLVDQVRQLVDADPTFKAHYFHSKSRYASEKLADFHAKVDGNTGLMRKYEDAERLMGRISAMLFIQYALLNTPSDKPRQESTSRQENEAYNALKVALVQRWHKSVLDIDYPSAQIRKIYESSLSGQTNEAFGKLLDLIVERTESKAKVFEKMLLGCIAHPHIGSCYGLHTDTSAIDSRMIEDAQSYVGSIYPFANNDLSHYSVINMEFLPGTEFFWQHMKEKHPNIYQHLVGVVQRRFETPTGQMELMINIRGVEFDVHAAISLYHLMKESCPAVLSNFDVEQFKNEPRSYGIAHFNFGHNLLYNIPDRKHVILDKGFDDLINV